MTNGLLICIWGNIYAFFLFPHILGSPSSYMTLQLLHSEIPYIRGKFDFLFHQCIFQYLQLWTHSIFILALHERTHNASYRKIRKSLTLSIATYIVGENDSNYLEDQRLKVFFLWFTSRHSCKILANWASSKVFSAHRQKTKVAIQSLILEFDRLFEFENKINKNT